MPRSALIFVRRGIIPPKHQEQQSSEVRENNEQV